MLMLHARGKDYAQLRIPLGGKQPLQEENGFRWVSERVIEIALDYERIGLRPGGECQFWVEIADDGHLIEKLPPAGAYHFVAPTDDMVASNWIV